MEQVRVGVVGAGRLGGFHAQKLAAHPDVELVAVGDPDSLAAQKVAEQHRAQSFSDYREIPCGAIDAVVIAAPTVLHHDIGLHFLSQGVHVLMEKPLAVTYREAENLVSAAAAHNAILQVGHVERFNPALDTILPHITSPKYIEATRASGFTFRSTDVGVVLDLMIHDIDIVLSMVRSPVRRVDALGLTVVDGHEDVANARLVFENGCIATLNASRVNSSPRREMSVWSAGAFASIDFGTRSSQLVRPSDTLIGREFDLNAITPEQLEQCKQTFHAEHLPVTSFEDEAVDALALETGDFIESIRQQREPRVTGADGRDAVMVAEMILDRIESHAWDGVGHLVGPRVSMMPSIVPAPLPEEPIERRKAG